MAEALGKFNQMFRGSYDRNIRADRGRTIRYRAGRISRGETPRTFLSNEDVTQLFKTALEEAYGHEKVPTQACAMDSGQSKKAAENWFAGDNPMGSTAFINAYRNNPRFAAFARYYLLGHQENDPILEIQLQTAMQNVDQAAARLGMPAAQFAAACGFAMQNTIMPEMLGQSDEDGDEATGDLFGGFH